MKWILSVPAVGILVLTCAASCKHLHQAFNIAEEIEEIIYNGDNIQPDDDDHEKAHPRD